MKIQKLFEKHRRGLRASKIMNLLHRQEVPEGNRLNGPEWKALGRRCKERKEEGILNIRKSLHVICGVDRIRDAEDGMTDRDASAKSRAVFDVVDHERGIVQDAYHLRNRRQFAIRDF